VNSRKWHGRLCLIGLLLRAFQTKAAVRVVLHSLQGFGECSGAKGPFPLANPANRASPGGIEALRGIGAPGWLLLSSRTHRKKTVPEGFDIHQGP